MAAPSRPSRSVKRPSTASPLLGNGEMMSRQQRMMNALAQDDSILLRPNVPAGALRNTAGLRRTDSVASTSFSDQTDDVAEQDDDEADDDDRRTSNRRAMMMAMTAADDTITEDDYHLDEHAEQQQQPSNAALNSAVSAFATTSATNQRTKGRRGGLADQGMPTQIELDLADDAGWPDTIPFKQVERVMRAVRQDWPMLLVSGDSNDTEFDAVDLALHLLKSKRDYDLFSSLKTALDESIGSLLDDNYRAYETSISTYNATLQGLAKAQKHVEQIRQSLSQSRDGLEGSGKEALAGMWTRLKELEECEKLVQDIEGLRTIPDLLESLLSEKRFLSAVVLLVRSLRTIKRPEMIEIGGLADLRVWLVAQENVLLEMLVEELHNHLYLKSFYCDSRWKAYAKGQTSLPVVDFGDDAAALGSIAPGGSAAAGTNIVDPQFRVAGRSNAALPRLSKLQRYLTNLAVRPQSNPLVDEPIIANSTTSDTSGGTADDDNFSSNAATSKQKTATVSPESDSFTYIEMLLESLACLGKLGYALDAVSQRVQIEIFGVVERTVEEVDERNDLGKLSAFVRTSFNPYSLIVAGTTSVTPASAHNRASMFKFGSGSATATTSLEVANVETLRDLFWTLYSKLDAVLQGFRVAYEVSQRIVDRSDFKERGLAKSSAVMFSLLEVWKPVQAEVRTLLQDYLTDDHHSSKSASRNPIASVNEILRSSKPARDASKQIFKFGESDQKSAMNALRPHEQALQKKLKEALPGLSVDGPLQHRDTSAADRSLTSATAALGGTVLLGATSATTASALSDTHANQQQHNSHKALVRPDAFNVSVLFGPTLAFLERVTQVMPNLDDASSHSSMAGSSVSAQGSSSMSAPAAQQQQQQQVKTDGAGGPAAGPGSFAGFLDDFVRTTFLPQLEDKVSGVLANAIGGNDAFAEDAAWRKFSPVPIVRSVPNLLMLLDSLCSMLRATPFHRDSYSHLIVSVIQEFYTRCASRFGDLVSKDSGDSGSALAAVWAANDEMRSLLTELWELPSIDQAAILVNVKATAKLEDTLRAGNNGHVRPVRENELIGSMKKVSALGVLYSSIDWFVERISSFKIAGSQSFAIPGPSQPQQQPVSADDGNGDVLELPLTEEMTEPFSQLISSFRQLATHILQTLRIEVRLVTMYRLDKATREGSYYLLEPSIEPDDEIVRLNSSLADMDEVVASTVGSKERRFVFFAIALLMDSVLVSNARYVRLANSNGRDKMTRNILALQQNLKNIGEEPLEADFARSRLFWGDVFAQGPRAMLERVKEGKLKGIFDFEDCKTLLNLMCGIDQSSKDAQQQQQGGGVGQASGNGMGKDRASANANNDKGRRAYTEWLIELLALDTSKDDDD